MGASNTTVGANGGQQHDGRGQWGPMKGANNTTVGANGDPQHDGRGQWGPMKGTNNTTVGTNGGQQHDGRGPTGQRIRRASQQFTAFKTSKNPIRSRCLGNNTT